MKKIGRVILTLFLCFFLTTDVSALTLYSSNKNTYYQRSQHTYSWNDQEGNYWRNFAPALYILYADQEDALKEEDWDFYGKYNVPWTPNETSYFVTMCCDLVYDFWPTKTYNMVNIYDSKAIKDSIKANLSGIVKNSYPFISQEDMVNNLVANGVLVETTNANGERIYTAPANLNLETKPEHTVHRDELLSAVQMAIFKYSDPGVVVKRYYGTSVLSTNFSVIDRAALYSEGGFYDEANNNIEAIYNYLINLKDTESKGLEISKAVINGNGELVIGLSDPSYNVDNLKFVIKEDNDILMEVNLKDLKYDLAHDFIVNIDQDYNIDNLRIELVGSSYKENQVYIFEADGGHTNSQTLIGVSNSATFSVNKAYPDKVERFDINDVEIEKVADKDMATFGDTFTYSIKIKNHGNVGIEHAIVIDEINDNLEIVSSDGVIKGNIVQWDVSVAPNEEKVVNVTVKVKAGAKQGDIYNNVNIEAYNMGIVKGARISVLDNPNTGIAFSVAGLLILGALGVAILLKARKKKMYDI